MHSCWQERRKCCVHPKAIESEHGILRSTHVKGSKSTPPSLALQRRDVSILDTLWKRQTSFDNPRRERHRTAGCHARTLERLFESLACVNRPLTELVHSCYCVLHFVHTLLNVPIAKSLYHVESRCIVLAATILDKRQHCRPRSVVYTQCQQRVVNGICFDRVVQEPLAQRAARLLLLPSVRHSPSARVRVLDFVCGTLTVVYGCKNVVYC
jgi:hypothetical protein